MAEGNLPERLKAWCEAHRRPAWKPIIGENPNPTNSFSGIPWLHESEEWPKCPGCQNPFQLFLQLNLPAIPQKPEGNHGDGILQLFCLETLGAVMSLSARFTKTW